MSKYLLMSLFLIGCTHHVPKFKRGDCVTAYNFGYVIESVNEKQDYYGVLIGLSCTPDNWIQCGASRSPYSIKAVDAEFKKMDCPK